MIGKCHVCSGNGTQCYANQGFTEEGMPRVSYKYETCKLCLGSGLLHYVPVKVSKPAKKRKSNESNRNK